MGRDGYAIMFDITDMTNIVKTDSIQGREIAVFKPYDPKAFTANAPFVMNAMPWKGHALFTDFNSGLWSAKLEPKPTPTP